MIPRTPRYTLHAQLRQRDLATVFSATDNSSGTPGFVALLTDLAADRVVLSALRAELPLLQNADPALITVLDYNLSAPPLYVMVENLNGVSLRQLLESAGRGLQPSEAVAFTAEAARCIQAMHNRGAIHGAVHIDDFVLRDLNMVCVSAWVAELFGADLFATTDIYSTRDALDKHTYQPPELAAHMGQPPTVAGDIYGLGILLYHLLSGVPPGVAPGNPELAPWLRGGQSPPLDESVADATLRSRLQKFIQISTARDPMRRWPDLKTFVTGLEQINPGGTMAMPRIVTTVRNTSTTPPSAPPPQPVITNGFAVAPPMPPAPSGALPTEGHTPGISAPDVAPPPSQLPTTGPLPEPAQPSQPPVQATPSAPSANVAASPQPQPQVSQASPLGNVPPVAPPLQPGLAAPQQVSPPGAPQLQYYPPPPPANPQPQAQLPVMPQVGYDYGYQPPLVQPQAQPRTAYLVSLTSGAIYPVSAPRASVGVARTTSYFPDINLAMEPANQAQFVSQHHLDLFYDRGQWYVQPSTSSRNPTFANGNHVPPGASIPVDEGVVLEIPALPLRFSFSIG